MKIKLTSQQKNDQAAFRDFVEQEIIPYAGRYHQEETTPRALIQKIATQGYLGAIAPEEMGGTGMDMVTLGILHEEVGRAVLRSEACSLFTAWSPMHFFSATLPA